MTPDGRKIEVSVATGACHVLVVDDDPQLRQIVSKLLQSHGYRVSAASDGREMFDVLAAAVDGQTTAHYLAERLGSLDLIISRLSHGVPVGGELDLLDDGTLFAALQSRRAT